MRSLPTKNDRSRNADRHQTALVLPMPIRHGVSGHKRAIVLREAFEHVPASQASERIEASEVGDGFPLLRAAPRLQSDTRPSTGTECEGVDGWPPARRHHPWRDKPLEFRMRMTHDATAASHIPSDKLMTVGQRIGI